MLGRTTINTLSPEFLNDAGQLVGIILIRKPSFGSNLGQQVWAFKGGQLYTLGFSGFPV